MTRFSLAPLPLIRALRRPAAWLLIGLAAAIILLVVFRWWVQPPADVERGPAPDPDLLAEMETAREALPDPADPRRTVLEVDYAEGASAAWWPKAESPILTPLVEAGTLPPVAERVGSQPVVMAGVGGEGRYSGLMNTLGLSAGGKGILASPTLVRWSPDGAPIVPHVARDWEVLEEGRIWRFHLREGMRWSDGAPFTSADFRYWYDHEATYFSDKLPDWLTARGEPGRVVTPDPLTVEFHYPHPKAELLPLLARQREKDQPYQPAHYLKRYHPEVGDQAFIEAEMERLKMPSPVLLYRSLSQALNPQRPSLAAWVFRRETARSPYFYVRNPYFFAVDESGRQLPYFDRIMYEVIDAQFLPTAVASGRATLQVYHMKPEDLTLLLSQAESGNFDLHHWYPSPRSNWVIWPNLNFQPRRDETGQVPPAARWKQQFLNEKRFRHALSLAINRQAIIEAEYDGQGTPSQVAPGPLSPHHHPELSNAFIEYDPERAAALLDDLGLDGRDEEGYRTFPDGTRMAWFLTTRPEYQAIGQFVVEDWADIDLRVIQSVRGGALYAQERKALRVEMLVAPASGFDPFARPTSYVAYTTESQFAPAYAKWYQRGGLWGSPGAAQGDAIEPPEGHPIRRGMVLLEEAYATLDPAEQKAKIRSILDIAADQLWSISISTPPSTYVVVDRDLRNVPQALLAGWTYQSPTNASPETFFRVDGYGADGPEDGSWVAQAREEMAGPIMRADTGGSGGFLVTWIGRLFWLGAGLGLVAAAIRFPFALNRIIVMVPTLLVISAIIFSIIELPPGSFIDYKMEELMMQGEEAAEAEAELLRELYGLNDPFWERYASWMGLPWFWSFDAADKGLLQGYLGRSMTSNMSVNEMLGDRLLLTMTLSVSTIIFTWLVAIPIGLYSAVRQYSVADYIFTIVGFLGMCIPNFLLAILLMAWSQAWFGYTPSGLFSAEYAAEPGWSWGKVVDLLKHLWIPVIVIGTAGTAGMIRVLRANMLEELNRPYVTTARAKGVRPIKLIFKYPFRVAMNPFISGIGGIIPSIVSGGAIVAIVLSLPTVGPMLLNGVMNEDLYLAASLLMFLTVLGVIGTLISDLLLLWVDPRIRFEKGSR